MKKTKQKTGGDPSKKTLLVPLGIIGILALAVTLAYATTPGSDDSTNWQTMHSNMEKAMNNPQEMDKMMEACENEMGENHHSNQSGETNSNHMGMM